MRRKITDEVWKQVEVAIASGIGAREVARNMKIPEGTVLSHVKPKAIIQQIQVAKAEGATKSKSSEKISPFESAARTMQQRGERYLSRMASVSEKVLPHLESLPPGEILSKARDMDYYDRVSRRTFGLDISQPLSNCPLNLAILTNQAAIQIVERPARDTTELGGAQSS